jgi:alpha-glucosidase
MRQAIGDQLLLLREHRVVPTWALNNHDAQRVVTRLGRADADDPTLLPVSPLHGSSAPVDVATGTRRARALIAFVLGLPGSAYLYQGEELGLPEVLDLPDEARQDPVFLRSGGSTLGRDGCRVPLPWTADPAGAHGFSTTPADGSTPTAPWLPQPEGWGAWAAERQQEDPDSTLAAYRRFLAARRIHASPQGLQGELVDLDPSLMAVRRGDLLLVLNPTAEPVPLPLDGSGATLVLSSEGPVAAWPVGERPTVPPDTCWWLVLDRTSS